MSIRVLWRKTGPLGLREQVKISSLHFRLTRALTFKHTFFPVLLHYTIKTVVLKTQYFI